MNQTFRTQVAGKTKPRHVLTNNKALPPKPLGILFAKLAVQVQVHQLGKELPYRQETLIKQSWREGTLASSRRQLTDLTAQKPSRDMGTEIHPGEQLLGSVFFLTLRPGIQHPEVRFKTKIQPREDAHAFNASTPQAEVDFSEVQDSQGCIEKGKKKKKP